MSAAKEAQPVPERVTLEQIKHRAEEIMDLAVVEAEDAKVRIMGDEATKALLVVAGVVVLAASLGYMLGARGRTRVFVDAG